MRDGGMMSFENKNTERIVSDVLCVEQYQPG